MPLSFSLLLYNLGIRLYYCAIWVAAFFQPKARLWLDGRKEWQLKMKKDLQAIDKHRIWVHCASLGEFEQGRPIIEQLKQKHPHYKIVLTFFSPSGYEIRKNYSHADYIYYLPLDTANNARLFMELIRPKMAIFVKYEFWYHYLHVLYQQAVPVILVSAIFRKKQPFFRAYGGIFRQLLSYFEWIFVQNKTSVDLLKSIGITQVSIAKDTRFDRVFDNSQQVQALEDIATFKGDRQLFIAGSTWPQDELLLAEFINQASEKYCFIVAPHEIHTAQIAHFQSLVKKSSYKYSEFQINLHKNVSLLIIDHIGLLSALYQYGDYGYIGGGFGRGIHNILEAAVFGMPLFFGPNYQRFKEAVDLVDQKGAFVVHSFSELQQQFDDLAKDSTFRRKSSQQNKEYILKNKGGTVQIMEYVVDALAHS